MLRLGVMLALLSIASLAHARDVSAKQVGLEYARGNLDSAQAEYKDKLQRVSESEKRLVEAQKRLADDRRNAADSKRKFEEAKIKYARAQQLLDQAWKQP